MLWGWYTIIVYQNSYHGSHMDNPTSIHSYSGIWGAPLISTGLFSWRTSHKFISLPASNKKLKPHACWKEEFEAIRVFTFTVATKIQKLDKACSLTYSFTRMIYRSSWNTLIEQCREVRSILSQNRSFKSRCG